jgi:hypothetical protein
MLNFRRTGERGWLGPFVQACVACLAPSDHFSESRLIVLLVLQTVWLELVDMLVACCGLEPGGSNVAGFPNAVGQSRVGWSIMLVPVPSLSA